MKTNEANHLDMKCPVKSGMASKREKWKQAEEFLAVGTASTLKIVKKWKSNLGEPNISSYKNGKHNGIQKEKVEKTDNGKDTSKDHKSYKQTASNDLDSGKKETNKESTTEEKTEIETSTIVSDIKKWLIK
jgi:hypothetical protein